MHRGGNRLAEYRSVILRNKSRIGNAHDSAVALGTDKTAETLTEFYHGFGKRVIPEGPSALPVELFGARLDDRIADLRER